MVRPKEFSAINGHFTSLRKAVTPFSFLTHKAVCGPQSPLRSVCAAIHFGVSMLRHLVTSAHYSFRKPWKSYVTDLRDVHRLCVARFSKRRQTQLSSAIPYTATLVSIPAAERRALVRSA